MIPAHHILGHDEAEAMLRQGDRNKSRSFLLEGQRGIGKAALAVKYAAELLNCSLERITERSHPDLFVLERKFDEKSGKYKKEISIDDARDMRNFLSRTPSEGTHRVVIVDSADELRNEAANCILKVVEEPPKHSVVIMLSHGGFILPTIRSRCTCIRLQHLGEEAMTKVIGGIMANVTETDIAQLCLVAEGSPGVAKMIYEKDGLWITGELAEILHLMPRADYLQITKFAERIHKSENMGNGGGWEVFCHIYSWFLSTIAKASIKGEALEISGVVIRPITNIPSLLDEISTWQQEKESTDVFNLDHKQVIVNSLLKLAECFK